MDPIAHRCSSDHRRSTPGVLARVPVVLSVPSSLIRPHPPHSQAQNDFTAERFIRAAFAVRERLGDPRVVPGFRSLFLLGMSSSKTPENLSVLCAQRPTESSGLRPSEKGSAFSIIPTIRTRGGSFSRLPVSLPLQPAKLLASLSDTETFTSGLPAGWSPFPPPDMTTVVAGQPPPVGLSPTRTVTSLAAAQTVSVCHPTPRPRAIRPASPRML